MPKKIATQVSPRTLASRRNGALGGRARAKKDAGTKKMSEWGAKGGKQTFALYGSDFYSMNFKRAKTVGRYRTPKDK